MNFWWSRPRKSQIVCFWLTDFGAVGNGKSINTQAFAKAIAAISAAGGGQLIVPRGEFLTGPIVLASHIDLHLEEGAKIQFPTSWATYAQALPAPSATADAGAAQSTEPPAARGPGRGGGLGGIPALIYGNNVTDVAVSGSGAIDGGGSLFWGQGNRSVTRSTKPPAADRALRVQQPPAAFDGGGICRHSSARRQATHHRLSERQTRSTPGRRIDQLAGVSCRADAL